MLGLLVNFLLHLLKLKLFGFLLNFYLSIQIEMFVFLFNFNLSIHIEHVWIFFQFLL